MADELRQPADERMPDITARVALIERSILALLVVGLFIGVLTIVKPFTTAILFGAALAAAALADASGSGRPRARTRAGGRAVNEKKCG